MYEPHYLNQTATVASLPANWSSPGRRRIGTGTSTGEPQLLLPSKGGDRHATFTCDWRPDLGNDQASASLEKSLLVFALPDGP